MPCLKNSTTWGKSQPKPTLTLKILKNKWENCASWRREERKNEKRNPCEMNDFYFSLYHPLILSSSWTLLNMKKYNTFYVIFYYYLNSQIKLLWTEEGETRWRSGKCRSLGENWDLYGERIERLFYEYCLCWIKWIKLLVFKFCNSINYTLLIMDNDKTKLPLQ